MRLKSEASHAMYSLLGDATHPPSLAFYEALAKVEDCQVRQDLETAFGWVICEATDEGFTLGWKLAKDPAPLFFETEEPSSNSNTIVDDSLTDILTRKVVNQ